MRVRRSLAVVALGALSSVTLSGCVVFGSDSIDIGLESSDFENNELVAVEFELYQAIEDFDTSTYLVEDTAGVAEFQELVIDYIEHGEEFEDTDMAGGVSADVTIVQADGTATDFALLNDEGDQARAIVERLKTWHGTLPHVYVDDDALLDVTATSSREPGATIETDAAQREEFAALLREHGIFGDYSSPLPETPPTLGTAIYTVTVTTADSAEFTVTLDPGALETATFSAEGRALVASWE